MNQSLEPEIFNLDDLLHRMMGDRDLASEILTEFVTDLSAQIDALRQSVDEGDTTVIARRIHTIKGASGNVGAKRLERMALEAERAKIAENPEQVNAFVTDLVQQASLLKDELRNNGFL